MPEINPIIIEQLQERPNNIREFCLKALEESEKNELSIVEEILENYIRATIRERK